MHENDLFFQAFIYLSAAIIAVPVAKRIGLGSVLGYLLAGVAIGPYLLGLVGEEGQDVMHFAEFGVVMMLFLVGLELQPSLLWKLRIPILGLGGMQVLLTASLVAGLAYVLTDFHWKTSVALGLTLALSSTAIVLQTLAEKGVLKTEGGQNAFSVLLFQDIAVIPILAIFPLLSTSELVDSDGHGLWIDHFSVSVQAIIILIVIAGIVLAGKYVLGPIFRLIAQTRLRELFTAAALLLVIGIALLMTSIGLSPALGTFLAGVVLAQSEYRHELESDIEPFKGLLLGLFFIAVGASIDFDLIFANPALIALLVCGLILLKFAVLFVIGKVFGMQLDNNFLFTFSLAQGGEFAFVLFSFALQNKVMTQELTNPMIAAVVISMALTPLLMTVNEKLIQPRFGTREKVKREADKIDQEQEVIIAGFGRFGSTVGRVLQANGVMATYLDVNPDTVDYLRKLGLNVFYGDASRLDLLKAAGAEKATLLVIAVDEGEKAREIAKTAMKHFPSLRIMARTQSWNSSYEMMDLGINHFYREYLDSALRMAADALKCVGLRQYQIQRSVKQFRKHDERMVRELFKVRHEDKQWLQSSKEFISNIEEAMKDDIHRVGLANDDGWNSDEMRIEYEKAAKEDDKDRSSGLI